ncbi:unnamed protein product, partial [Effrenium voratum]
MKDISHAHCVQLHAVFEEPAVSGKIYVVLELAEGGAAMDWDEQRQEFSAAGGGLVPEDTARRFLQQLLAALGYLHAVWVAHRDVKPQNLLVASGHLKLGDFGTAARMGEDYLIHGTEGTYHFFSPEMCQVGYRGHDGRRADIWAAGVSLWAFRSGKLPFFHKDMAVLMDRIAAGELCWEGASFSAGCSGSLELMLCKDPGQRPLAEELLLDPWIGIDASS